MPHKNSSWWKVALSCSDIESESYLLFDFGAKGTELDDDTTLHAFFESSEEELQTVLEQCRNAGFLVLSHEEVAQRDWIQECEEIWERVIAGSWTVQPYLIEKDPEGSALQANTIRIRPGLGFGTGHHSTTRTTLELLQQDEFHPDSVTRVLDLGTGSGILAVAAAQIFSKPVTAIDIDDAALDNARHNAQINAVETAIDFLTGSIERASGKYEVVIANIYAEVLVDLRDQIVDAVQEKGVLFLSGIREDKKELVLTPYLEHGMSLQESILSEGWHSMVLRLK